MLTNEEDRPFQHPAVRAAMSARNAIAAEMAVAGRAGHHPGDRCWGDAQHALLAPGEAAWVLASDAYQQMREDLASVAEFADGAMGPIGRHGRALSSLATPLEGVVPARDRAVTTEPVSQPLIRTPAARARRERLETAFWFVVGGAGGLVLACMVRGLEMVLAWR